MPHFKSEFAPTVPLDKHADLHAELWGLFRRHEAALIRAGKGWQEAGTEALKPTLQDFISAHPDLHGKVAIRFVWP